MTSARLPPAILHRGAMRRIGLVVVLIFSVALTPLAGAAQQASLARPGGNVTGLSTLISEVIGKQLQLLKEAVPKVSRVAILSVPGNVAMARSVKEAQGAARTLGLTIRPRDARTAEELAPAFDAMIRDRADALFLFADVFTISLIKREFWTLPQSGGYRRCVPGASRWTA